MERTDSQPETETDFGRDCKGGGLCGQIAPLRTDQEPYGLRHRLAPRAHRRRQRLQGRQGLRKADAGVGDRDAVGRRHARDEVLPAVGFEWLSIITPAMRASPPAICAATSCADVDLPLVLLARCWRARSRSSPARAGPRARSVAAGRGDVAPRRSSGVLPPRRMTWQSSLPRVSKIAATPILVMPMKACGALRREDGVGRDLDAAVGAVLEADRAATGPRRAGGGSGSRWCARRSRPRPRGRRCTAGSAGRGTRCRRAGRAVDLEQQAARALRRPSLMAEAAVEVRVVDVALPADGGARLLEVDAHDDEQVALQRVGHRLQAARVFDAPGRGRGSSRGRRRPPAGRRAPCRTAAMAARARSPPAPARRRATGTSLQQQRRRDERAHGADAHVVDARQVERAVAARRPRGRAAGRRWQSWRGVSRPARSPTSR